MILLFTTLFGTPECSFLTTEYPTDLWNLPLSFIEIHVLIELDTEVFHLFFLQVFQKLEAGGSLRSFSV